jgi:signal peptidase I
MVVEGPSMEPTLKAGDRLLVVRKRSPRTGDIVAFADPRGTDPGGIGPRGTERLLVKRVVQVVGTSLVVEGDNRGASTDSRTFGSVEKAAVVGRALYRYGPAGRTGLVV